MKTTDKLQTSKLICNKQTSQKNAS